MSDKKRKLTDSKYPPLKKPKYNTPEIRKSYSPFPAHINHNNHKQESDQAPICPNPYTASKKEHITKRYGSQATGLSSTSQEDDNGSFHNNTHYHSNNNNNNNQYISSSNHSPSPTQNDRKSIPDLHSSQDSFSPIPPSQHSQKCDIEKEVKRATEKGTYIDRLQQQSKTAKSNGNKQCEAKLIDIKRAFSEKGSLLILIGFVIGYLVCYGVLHIMDIYINGSKQQVDNQYIYIPNSGSCPCDTENNRTCVECQECMDKYWSMDGNYTNCKRKNDELQLEINGYTEALKKCEVELNEIENKLRECNKKTVYLECSEYISKISSLSHDLGECNVEWGSCEQKGRQKDALDKIRLQKIEEEKQKFSLCNEQLKRYKEKAKENKKM